METRSITVKGIDVDNWIDLRMKCRLEDKTISRVLNEIIWHSTEKARTIRMEYFENDESEEESEEEESKEEFEEEPENESKDESKSPFD